MPCRACRSDNVRQLRGELTASCSTLEELKVPPIYVSEDVIVCLDCGFAELVMPLRRCECSRKGMRPLAPSGGHVRPEGSGSFRAHCYFRLFGFNCVP